MHSQNNSSKNTRVAIWLFICAFMIVLMVMIGGLTRLTESGLSIVKWKPVYGILPPMNNDQWNEELQAYKDTPEYIKKNYGMELPEFKKIYWWEYAHRLAGRLIGIIFIVPFVYFTARRYFSPRKAVKLFGIFALGGLQGFVGWWMVSSGLVDNPAVSHFRLATHLFIALLIFCLMLWQGLGFYLPDLEENKDRNRKAKILAGHLIVFAFIQIIFGAFMAGLHAGMIYNSWPLMNGQFAADGIKISLKNIEFIQFFHRWWAFLLLFTAAWFSISIFKGRIKYQSEKTNYRLRKASRMLVTAIALQIILGISTLVMHVPVALASLHQIMAVIILGTAVYIRRVIS